MTSRPSVAWATGCASRSRPERTRHVDPPARRRGIHPCAGCRVRAGQLAAGQPGQLGSAERGRHSARRSAQPRGPAARLVRCPSALKNFGDGEYVAQYIDSAGHVAAASPDAGRVPMLSPAEQRAARQRPITLTTTFDEGPERVMATTLPGRPGWIAVAGVSLESANATVSAVVTRLVIGGSAFVLIAAAGAYFLARGALAPVERLRQGGGCPVGRRPVRPAASAAHP